VKGVKVTSRTRSGHAAVAARETRHAIESVARHRGRFLARAVGSLLLAVPRDPEWAARGEADAQPGWEAVITPTLTAHAGSRMHPLV
jgi:hypothetical protein